MTSTTAIGLAVSTVIFALRADDTGAPQVWLPLVRRTREPFFQRWALPGGMVLTDESLEGAARRNLGETTRLEPTYLEQLYAFGDVDRSPDQRMVSIVYWALVRPDEAERVSLGDNVRWFAADDLPDLAFDHNLIVDYALWRLRPRLPRPAVHARRAARGLRGRVAKAPRPRQLSPPDGDERRHRTHGRGRHGRSSPPTAPLSLHGRRRTR